MAEPRRVMITGVAGTLAGLLARRLEERDDVAAIVGVDVRDPQHELARTRFVRADVRNPLVARVIRDTGVDTVVHMSTASGPGSAGGRARMKELNVIGAMQLLAACEKAESVGRFVLKSTTAVYGSDFSDPAMFAEDATPRVAPRHGFAKDASEIEAYARAFARRRPDVDVTILRCANFLGPRVDSTLGTLFSLPVVPTVLGFDPRLQLCHEDDGLAVLERATAGSHPGIFNVAGPGVVYLSQCIRMAGRVPAPVPLPLVSGVADLVQRSSRVDVSPEQLRFLQFGRVGDITRLRTELGYEPRYTSRETFEDFVSRRRLSGWLDRDGIARLERSLVEVLRRPRDAARQGR